MRAAEQAVIAAGTPGSVLMERAGRHVADAICRKVSAPARVAVLCGPGNNGGDGYVIARVLAGRGFHVAVYGLVSTDRLAGDARIAAGQWSGPVHPPRRFTEEAAPDILIDTLFGTGLTRPVDGDAGALVAAANRLDGVALRVAVDIPSGIAGDSGMAMGEVFRADLTVTFHAAKPGHWLVPGLRYRGALEVADIGLGAGATAAARIDTDGPEIALNLTGHLVAGLGQNADAHKYSKGHLTVFAGGLEGVGAARLAARGGLRAGAGLVTIAAPGAALLAHASRGPDALMLRTCDGAGAVAALLADPRRSAVVIGPAYGVGEATRAAVAAALGGGRAVVIDADALSSFAGRVEALAERTRISGRAVLTPHQGEFDRLFPEEAPNNAESTGVRARSAATKSTSTSMPRLNRAMAAAEQTSAVIVLKGPDTIIAAPDGRAVINSNAPPWLATAGSGDVLAGLIGGLLAQGLSPFDAACAGVWLHGEAGQRVGRGAIADDLPEAAGQVLNRLRV